MRPEPDRAILYADVAAAGSLAAALRAAAHGDGFALAITSPPSDPLRHATIASDAPGREPLTVSAWSRQRGWYITGAGRGHGTRPAQPLIQGSLDDPVEIARIGRAWHDGTTLTDIGAITASPILTGRYEVPDDSPAHIVASEWGYVRQAARDAGWPEQGALVEAAHGRPQLRRLYPYTSHWALRFATVVVLDFGVPQTGLGISADTICMQASPGGLYTVHASFLGPVLGETATAEQAVTVALSHLPAEPGPAVFG